MTTLPLYTPLTIPTRTLTPQTDQSYGANPIFDFDAGHFLVNPDGTFVVRDDKEGFTNQIRKILTTPRGRYPIYNLEYGVEIYDLLGKKLTYEEFCSEAQRMIIDALIYDSRIVKVYNFSFTALARDQVLISFTYDDVWGQTQKVQVTY
jgi:phage baseplate assembly protein W